MIRFRAYRKIEAELVEGFHLVKGDEHFIWDNLNMVMYPIIESTLQVHTTDGWEDIKNVEVVAKRQPDQAKREGII